MSLFARKRRPKEPPSTGHAHSYAQRRQPVDPPSTLHTLSKPASPSIQLTERQLGILQERGVRSDNHHQPLEPSDHGAPTISQLQLHFPADLEDKKEDATLKSMISYSNENTHILQGSIQQKQFDDENTENSKPTTTSSTSSHQVSATLISAGTQQRPLSTKSNREPSLARNLVRASKSFRSEKRSPKSAMAGKRSPKGNTSAPSVFSRTKPSNNRTEGSVSLITNKALNRHNRESTGSTVSLVSDHDKMALRKLLGTQPSEVKQQNLSIAKAKVESRHATKIMEHTKSDTNVSKPSKNEEFDQKEFLRNLLSSRNGNKSNTTTNAGLKTSKQTSITKNDELNKVRHSSQEQSISKTISTNKSEAGSSVSSYLNTDRDHEKYRRKLSPRNKKPLSAKSDSSHSSRLESAAFTLSRKVLAESKSSSPKNHRSLNFKGFRRRMGLSRKPSQRATRDLKQNSENQEMMLAASSSVNSNDSNKDKLIQQEDQDLQLAKSSSSDSNDTRKEKSLLKSQSQVSSHAADAGDDERTRTTLASSSNLSDDDHSRRTYESSLKQLSTAETLDTDESSTVMPHLQCASSDSMQYSSEEGVEDNSAVNRNAFAVIDNIAPLRANSSEETMSSHDSSSNSLQIHGRLRVSGGHAGYTKFLKALQMEASGAHSQLWSSFHAAMTGSPRRLPTMKSSQFKFDPPTRKMLATMNLHLKRQALVECASETQLVNDKRYAKEMENDLQTTLAVANIRLPSNSDNSAAGESPKTGTTSLLGDRVHHQKESSNDSASASRASSENMKLANAAGRILSGTAMQDGISRIRIAKSGNRLSTESRESVESALLGGSKSPSGASPVPWLDVRLRSVTTSDTMSPKENTTPKVNQGGIPSPWAKVKLKKIPVENNVTSCGDAMGQESAVEDGRSTKPAFESGPTTPMPYVTPAANTSSGKRRSKEAPKPEFSGRKVDIASSTPLREKIDESALVFELKNHAADSSTEGQDKVVIGKKTVMLLQARDGDLRATVSWSLPRDQIKALKLDMESQCVNLSLTKGGEAKVLAFADTADCLNFANAFYEMQKVNTQTSTANSIQETISDTSHRFEQLSDEEQRVLETYRQARRTKRPSEAMRTVVPEPKTEETSQETSQFASIKEMMKNNLASKLALGNVSPGIAAVDSRKNEETAPLSEAQVSLLPITDEEREVAERYQKMLKLRVPPEAVQHNMTKENVDPKIMGFVLCKTGLLAIDKTYPDGFSNEDRDVANLYRSMLQLKVPASDVHDRMKKDQVDEKIIKSVIELDKNAEKAKDGPRSLLTVEEQTIAASYQKMLKMMIPKEAVRHRMVKDQIDQKIMAFVLGEELSENKEQLSLEEEEKAATYRKMLKLRMPPEAVRHKMQKDGVDQKIVRAVLGDSHDDGNAKKLGSNKPGKAGSKLVSLHWTPLSGEELDNSVWCAAKKRSSALAQPERSDISKLVELFQKKSTVKGKGKEGSNISNQNSGMAKILDLNRANIVAISLKAYKDFSHEALADILRNLDPHRKLRGERVQFVKDLLPTAAEVAAMKKYYGGPDRLVPAERWFQQLVHIKRLEAKAHTLHMMEVFESEVAEVQKSLHLLIRVCNQVMESERLRELLDMVLQVGNIMNEGTRTGGASGFKFDSLLRLTQTKSGDGKITVLDYIVTIFVAKGQKETLLLMDDFPECQQASRIMISDLVGNVKEIQEKLNKCRTEHDCLVQESGKVNKVSASTQMKGDDDRHLGTDPRAQLLSAITARRGQETKNVESNVNLPSRNQTKLAVSKYESKQSPDLDAGIVRLEDFLAKADKAFQNLQSDCSQAVETCREMSKYCGEGGGERSTDGLLSILSEFATNLHAAVKKNERAMKIEEKKQSQQATQNTNARKQKRRPEDLHPGSKPSKSKESPSSAESVKSKTTKSKQQVSPESPAKGQGTSLVLMVNELLKDASEDTKRDFSQGVVYDNPDEKLKAIYEREKNQRRGMPPLSMSKLSLGGDLLSTIQKRQGEAGDVVAQAKRSTLEKVIDCINCNSAAVEASESTEEDSPTNCSSVASMSSVGTHQSDRFKDLQSKWKQCKDKSDDSKTNTPREKFSSGDSACQEDEGSVHNPIDCTVEDINAVAAEKSSKPNPFGDSKR